MLNIRGVADNLDVCRLDVWGRNNYVRFAVYFLGHVNLPLSAYGVDE
jgi:hypothetical protein